MQIAAASTDGAPPDSMSAGSHAGLKYDRKCLIQMNRSSSTDVLVCPNAIDGSPLVYRDLATHLTPAMRVLSFDARNALLQGTPFYSVHETARYYVEQLRVLQPTGPYRLFGFSSGGLLALEMGQLLRDDGEDVPLLVLGDTQTGREVPLEISARITWRFFAEFFIASDLPDRLGWGVANHPFWDKDEHERLRFLSTLRPSYAKSPAVALEETCRDHAVFTKYVLGFASYEPRPYDGPVVYLTGMPPVLVERWAVPLQLTNYRIANIGAGHHLQLVKPPGVAKVAEFLLSHLRSSHAAID